MGIRRLIDEIGPARRTLGIFVKDGAFSEFEALHAELLHQSKESLYIVQRLVEESRTKDWEALGLSLNRADRARYDLAYRLARLSCHELALGLPAQRLVAELETNPPWTPWARRRSAALHSASARAQQLIPAARDVRALLQEIRREGLIHDIRAAVERRDEQVYREAVRKHERLQREHKRAAARLRTLQEQATRAAAERRRRALAYQEGYWINRDGTVDSFRSVPPRDSYRPAWDDVEGDSVGSQGTDGMKSPGMPGPSLTDRGEDE